MCEKNVLIVSVLPENDNTAKAAAQVIQREAPNSKVLQVYGRDYRPCVGCNCCWLRTPGICSIKDGYEEMLKDYLRYDAVLFLSGTALNFVDHRMKNLIDRIMPLATMYTYISDGQCRHVLRYDKKLRFGLLYAGSADRIYLNRWLERVMLNFGGESLGAYQIENVEEVLSCI